MVKIMNLTPHPINLILGETSIEIPSSGVIARVDENFEESGAIEINGITIPLIKKRFGKITGLPDPEPGTIFIVSALVFNATSRNDVFGVGEFIRGTDGKVVGAKSLQSHD